MEFESAQSNTTAKLPILKLDAKMMLLLSKHDLEAPKDSNLHEDDLESNGFKVELSMLCMRAIVSVSTVIRWDTLPGNVEHQGTKRVNLDGVGFDWSDMAEEQVQTNMALMVFSDSEVYNDKTCSKTCLKNNETLKKQCDDLIVKLNQTEFTAATYKKGLATVEEQLITYRKNEVLFSEEVAVLKSLNKLLESQITDKSKKGLGYNVVPPPHPLIYNRPKKIDLSYSGLDEFKDPEFKSYGSEDSKQESNNFITARPHSAVVNVVRVNQANDVKASTCWVWRPTKLDSVSITLKKHNYINARGKPQQDDTGFIDSVCLRHISGNIAYLSDFKEFDGGYVTFGGGAHSGRISGKGTLKTDSLDFEDVYFVNELNFNLFSVSQMCDKKNYVLFTDTKCLVLSPNFKLPDESQILLKIPRKDNMHSFDMKNIVPKENLTCLVAKATLDESMLWHRRLDHINFKNINKLVKDNLVRGFPTKCFENDQTYVACLKGKQHKASCKSKVLNPITKPLFMLHMDLFGPTFVSSLMHKKYCLFSHDDYSRFTWVFFLTTKDETSEILKNFIKEIENLVDKKGKIIRSDNGTEFKNKIMDDFCREKCIKREYSVVRTPQQNGVAERRNRTLIEAARTILGKFDGKSDEGFFVGYSLSSKALRVHKENLMQIEDGPDNENDEKDRHEDDSSPKEVNTAGQHVNTTSPEVNIGRFKLNTVGPLVNTASSYDQDSLKDMFTMGASHTLEATHVEFFIDEDEPEVDLGNITNSYTVPTTPNTRIHKDHPIENVIGDVKSSVQTRRMTKPTSEQGFLSAVYEQKTHDTLNTYPDHLDKVYKVVKALYGLHQTPRAWYETLANNLLGNGFKRGKIDQTLFIKKQNGDILLIQVYVDDIIFGSTNKELCTGFEKLMKDKF
ncbi:putative ribonuclease H-like domain-containing protein [Tanacetum coccineum]